MEAECFCPEVHILAKRSGANDRAANNNRDQAGATVYARPTFYWTERPRQRHIRFQSVPQLRIPTDAQLLAKAFGEILRLVVKTTAIRGSHSDRGSKSPWYSVSPV